MKSIFAAILATSSFSAIAREASYLHTFVNEHPDLLRMGFVAVIVLLYALPGLMAYSKGHDKATLIFVTNFFTGWTLIGWVGCLVWASTAAKPSTTPLSVIEVAKDAPVESQAVNMAERMQHDALKAQLKQPYQTSHILHLLLTVFTGGLWVVIWIYKGVTNSTKRDEIDARYGV